MCTHENPKKKRTCLHNIQKCQKSLIYKPDIQLQATSSTGVHCRVQNALNVHTHATLWNRFGQGTGLRDFSEHQHTNTHTRTHTQTQYILCQKCDDDDKTYAGDRHGRSSYTKLYNETSHINVLFYSAYGIAVVRFPVFWNLSCVVHFGCELTMDDRQMFIRYVQYMSSIRKFVILYGNI